MSAPGWYPDPSGGPRLRYFDGTQWTTNTADPPPSTSPDGFLPPQHGYQHAQNGGSWGASTGHPGPGGPPPGQPPPNRTNLWLWVALGVVVVMILAVASWLLFFRDLPAATPPPPVAQPSTSEPATTAPADPTTAPADPTTSGPEPSATVGTSQTPDQSVALPPPGTIIEPITGCPATASDAVGQQGDDGRYASGAGLSVPAADGFVATPVQIPWVHQSNSQVKQYDNRWMAAITVGTVRPEDGFTDTTTAAVAIVACMLGSEFYDAVGPVATVSNAARAPEGDAVAVSVDVAVQGVEGVNNDLLYVMTIKQGDVMHVVISTVPDTDPSAMDVVGAVVADVRLG